jgi:putative ABC transport system permease protein
MFKNLIRHSVRSFKRQRVYIVINVLGLSIGIVCSLLIALYITNEISYDRFNTKKDRIYRLILDSKLAGRADVSVYTPAQLGPAMLKEFPEVENFLRMEKTGPSKVGNNNQFFVDDKIIEADSTFFDFFSLRILKGDQRNLLNAPHKVVLTESTAKKIFGNENPIDKPLLIGADTVSYIVSGVICDIPENSHFEANMITSLMTNPGSESPIWLDLNFSTYILLKPNAKFITVDKKISELFTRHIGPEVQKYLNISLADFFGQGNKLTFFTQNLKDIHLDPSIQQKFKAAGDPKFLKILGAISILILLIASINFMNLSTAQASRRSKEVGIKKLGGSSRGMLILQFISESFILSLVSLILALIFIKAILPTFNNLLGTKLVLNLFSAWYIVPGLVLFSVFVGFLSGSYPAFFLSSFNPYEVLKGSMKNSMKNGRLRGVLVVFQFSVSIMLIIGTMIIYGQIKYMRNKDMGFDKQHLIVIKGADALGTKIKSFKDAVKGIHGVVNIANSSAVPGRGMLNSGYTMEGKKEEEMFSMETNVVDYDYFDTYGMTKASGRTFNTSFTTDQNACIVNEMAIRKFGIKDLATTRFMAPHTPGAGSYLQVIGSVKDFNFESLRSPIGPYIFLFAKENDANRFLSVKLLAENYTKTISAIENTWKEFTANSPLEYYFVDDDFSHMYIKEEQNAKMAVIFSVLAIFIAGLGLFGLTSYTVEQRTKEIGIRKALGSSIKGIYIEITKEVVFLVGISAFIACPLIYFFANKWLQNYYYRINPGAFTFVTGITVAMGIALLTISYRIMRAARINISQSLKYE